MLLKHKITKNKCTWRSPKLKWQILQYTILTGAHSNRKPLNIVQNPDIWCSLNIYLNNTSSATIQKVYVEVSHNLYSSSSTAALNWPISAKFCRIYFLLQEIPDVNLFFFWLVDLTVSWSWKVWSSHLSLTHRRVLFWAEKLLQCSTELSSNPAFILSLKIFLYYSKSMKIPDKLHLSLQKMSFMYEYNMNIRYNTL